MLVPLLTDQKHIAAAYGGRLAEVERILMKLQHEFVTMNKLPSAPLRKAFNGELLNGRSRTKTLGHPRR